MLKIRILIISREIFYSSGVIFSLVYYFLDALILTQTIVLYFNILNQYILFIVVKSIIIFNNIMLNKNISLKQLLFYSFPRRSIETV